VNHGSNRLNRPVKQPTLGIRSLKEMAACFRTTSDCPPFDRRNDLLNALVLRYQVRNCEQTRNLTLSALSCSARTAGNVSLTESTRLAQREGVGRPQRGPGCLHRSQHFTQRVIRVGGLEACQRRAHVRLTAGERSVRWSRMMAPAMSEPAFPRAIAWSTLSSMTGDDKRAARSLTMAFGSGLSTPGRGSFCRLKQVLEEPSTVCPGGRSRKLPSSATIVRSVVANDPRAGTKAEVHLNQPSLERMRCHRASCASGETDRGQKPNNHLVDALAKSAVDKSFARSPVH